jgi:hypothetical protein
LQELDHGDGDEDVAQDKEDDGQDIKEVSEDYRLRHGHICRIARERNQGISRRGRKR